MPSRTDPEVTEPKRMRQFAGFFRSYMRVSTFLVAALPIPVAKLDMIPMFKADSNSTSVITSLICFLLLAYIFYSRHSIARIIFFSPRVTELSADPLLRQEAEERAGARLLFSLLILLLILGSLASFFYYQSVWFAFRVPEMIKEVPGARIHLMASYVIFFAFAEAAFVLMATKEYLQELLGLSDNDLILGPPEQMDRSAR